MPGDNNKGYERKCKGDDPKHTLKAGRESLRYQFNVDVPSLRLRKGNPCKTKNYKKIRTDLYSPEDRFVKQIPEDDLAAHQGQYTEQNYPAENTQVINEFSHEPFTFVITAYLAKGLTYLS